ncbi:PaaX family transcriptional regulator C-terminal domain-containing protein [Luedemannella flava]|uniref:PaaX family transcriptional regulator n=1 Tax=Luedemannella flava TaxID=349316 RepID=UPI0031E0F79F
MQARSALFDVYGDYLRQRGGRAPVAAIVRLLAPLDVSAPAVRTAISRMVRQGWLEPGRLASGPGYQLTTRAVRRLDDTAARVYRVGPVSWDGRFDLLVITMPTDRTERHRVAATLGFLGYGSLDGSVWVSPRPSAEVSSVLAGLAFERFTGVRDGGTAGALDLVRRAWDLKKIGEEYGQFVRDLRPTVLAVTSRSADVQAYAARVRLVHAWRAFLFSDPGLPAVLLPARWPGTTAAAFFDRHQARLRPAADRFVDQCLDPQTWKDR